MHDPKVVVSTYMNIELICHHKSCPLAGEKLFLVRVISNMNEIVQEVNPLTRKIKWI